MKNIGVGDHVITNSYAYTEVGTVLKVLDTIHFPVVVKFSAHKGAPGFNFIELTVVTKEDDPEYFI
jgi:hypothetical protein